MPAEAILATNFSHYFGGRQTLRGLNLSIRRNEIFGVIGPAGSGKSTFLRALNRLNDLVPGSRTEGLLSVGGRDIYDPETSVVELRRRLGMVFATPVPLPRSIFENVVFGPRLAGVKGRDKLRALAGDALEKTALWGEVAHRLDESALTLSGGQQQRLCLARILALRPEFILLDEPTSGLDPISTMRIEEMLRRLKSEFTIILVTNNTKQAARVADRTAFLLNGELVEVDDSVKIFSAPSDARTNDYILGRFG
jgi:phosphate transport system ATP-binding protein